MHGTFQADSVGFPMAEEDSGAFHLLNVFISQSSWAEAGQILSFRFVGKEIQTQWD